LGIIGQGGRCPQASSSSGWRAENLWHGLDLLRTGPATRSGVVPVRPELVAEIKFFGRYRSGAIRDGVLLDIG
jgi:hypothetical protein